MSESPTSASASLAARDPPVATRERLVQGRVVVSGRKTLDVVAAVFASAHVHLIVHHAGRDRGFAHGVADVEALDASGAFGQRERLAQRREAPLLGAAVAHALGDGELRILLRHLDPDAPFPLYRANDPGLFE